MCVDKEIKLRVKALCKGSPSEKKLFISGKVTKDKEKFNLHVTAKLALSLVVHSVSSLFIKKK